MDHKQLDAWTCSMEMVVEVYKILEQLPKKEQYVLTSQIQRSAISVPSNIAEGCARKSEKETIHFLSISLGSLAELETQLFIAQRLSYIETEEDLFKKLTKIKQLILGLIRYLETRITQ
jgi:four helix bundle protein